MDVGDLIFFLIFVMIIISNIVKQAKKAKEKEKARQSGKPGGPAQAREKKTGWKDLLGQMLEEAQRQMEKAEGGEGKAPDRNAPTGWEAITGKPDREPVRAGKPMAARTTAQPTPKTPRPPVFSEGAVRSASTEASGPTMKIPLSLSRDGLKNAVVWAEILGPPRAFKDLEF